MTEGRFLVFSAVYYESRGGWDDLIGRYDTLDEARAAVRPADERWAQVVDVELGGIIDRSDAFEDGRWHGAHAYVRSHLASGGCDTCGEQPDQPIHTVEGPS